MAFDAVALAAKYASDVLAAERPDEFRAFARLRFVCTGDLYEGPVTDDWLEAYDHTDVEWKGFEDACKRLRNYIEDFAQLDQLNRYLYVGRDTENVYTTPPKDEWCEDEESEEGGRYDGGEPYVEVELAAALVRSRLKEYV